MIKIVLTRFAIVFAGVVFRDVSYMTWEWIKNNRKSRHRYKENVRYHSGERRRPPSWTMEGPAGREDVHGQWDNR